MSLQLSVRHRVGSQRFKVEDYVVGELVVATEVTVAKDIATGFNTFCHVACIEVVSSFSEVDVDDEGRHIIVMVAIKPRSILFNE